MCGNRLVLNNGFRRLFALRSIGVKDIRLWFRRAVILNSSFQPQVAGLQREYLLGFIWPLVMKDSFEEASRLGCGSSIGTFRPLLR
jgi:hypothetical protein